MNGDAKFAPIWTENKWQNVICANPLKEKQSNHLDNRNQIQLKNEIYIIFIKFFELKKKVKKI